MKKIIFVNLILLSNFIFCQSNNKIIFDSEKISIYQTDSAKYYIENNIDKTIIDIFFIKKYNNYYQIMDCDHKIYFMDTEGNFKNHVDDTFLICGTTEYTSLTIEEKIDSFIVFEEKAFLKQNRPPAEILLTINKKDADNIFLINGKKNIHFL